MKIFLSPQLDSNTRRSFTTAGFTLIELLIVLVVISIVLAFATYSTRGLLQQRQLEIFVQQLQNRLDLARQQAILEPTVFGLQIKQNLYQFYQLVINPSEKTTEWKLIQNDHLYQPQTIPDNFAVILHTSNTPSQSAETEDTQNNQEDAQNVMNSKDNQPQILFLPSGDMSAFTITIGEKNKPPVYVLTGETNGTIRLQKK